jgi:CRISPR-associated protein Cas5h
MKVLAFDIWGEYAHYKKIYATTSAVSYCLPPKTSLYGYVSAILGFEKNNNQYLKYFQNKECLIGIQIMHPVVMQRININLRATFGRMKSTDNRKPTMMEFVYLPRYRIYFFHLQADIQAQLHQRLKAKEAVYTPTMGLASLISNFDFIGEFDASLQKSSGNAVSVQTVIPKKQFERFDVEALNAKHTEIVEQSMFAIEMDMQRNVTERDDILLERKAKSIDAFLNQYYLLSDGTNIALF